jgi:hypothetical protein
MQPAALHRGKTNLWETHLSADAVVGLYKLHSIYPHSA